jgi:RNA polymerase sigma-70 factor, ECF subfamily
MVLHSAEKKASGEDSLDIEAFLAGDRKAFDRLVMRHADRAFTLCYRLLGNREEAEDCVQEVFIKVFRSVKNFRVDSSFSTWLYTIIVNTCRNRRKSAEFRFWHRILGLGQSSEDDEGVQIPEPEDPAPSPLTLLTNREREVLLQKAMGSLSHDHRTVLVLRHVEGLSYEEISQITGVNLGTLKSRLARARQELHKKLETM